METRFVIGLASGSSADGVESALVAVSGAGEGMQARLVEAEQYPYDAGLAGDLRAVCQAGPCATEVIGRLHRLLGETFASAARGVANKASMSLELVQCIGCPGHTIYHDPEGRFPSSLTLGMAAVIAERLGVTVVSDFRSRDVAAGGQGVPLAALTDHLLFRDEERNCLLVHLGGLARLVYLPAGKGADRVTGFEAGPCNVLLDAMMRSLSAGKNLYDPGGRHAVQGKCDDSLLREWLDHPYFQRRPPKSLPRHLFSDAFVSQAVARARDADVGMHNLLCTATHFVARGISNAVDQFIAPLGRIDRILVSGGGARNGLLWQLLEQHLHGVTLEATDSAGVSSRFRKALSFALLAALTLDGTCGNLPRATGAAGPRLLGNLTPGSVSNWNRCLQWMAAHADHAYYPIPER
jgi:anhydro-N-acetylmuramic acid kinase